MRRAVLLSQYRNMQAAAAAAAGGCDPKAAAVLPSMTSALEDYSRTGDPRVLQQLSAMMGPPGAFEPPPQQPLDMGGIAGGAFDKSAGGMTARELLYHDSFAHSFGDRVSSSGSLSTVNPAAFLQVSTLFFKRLFCNTQMHSAPADLLCSACEILRL
jgi:hypothetical protein